MNFGQFLDAGLTRIGKKSKAGYVEFGYGQVEPNHLSAQRTGQIYAQLPANPEIDMLEQGQFVKYDYAANGNGIGEVNFEGEGEWMLVYNEIKLYREHPDGSKQWDCEFVMLKDDYQARIYSPYDWERPEEEYHNGMYLNGKDEFGNDHMTIKRYFSAENKTRDEATGATVFKTIYINDVKCDIKNTIGKNTKTGLAEITKSVFTYNGKEYELNPVTGQTKEQIEVSYDYDDVTKDVEDIYEFGWTNDPWKKLGIYKEKKMRKGTAMVPRVFKTNVGDIFTTNTIKEAQVAVGDILAPGTDGILSKDGDKTSMKWQVVKVYTMPDGQKGAKIMRIA